LTQAHDLSKKIPEKLHELQRLWLIEAAKYKVYPSTTAGLSASIRISPAAPR